MSRRTTRAVKREKERRHPSLFFFIILALGLLFLLWLFTLSIHQPPQKLGALSLREPDVRRHVVGEDLLLSERRADDDAAPRVEIAGNRDAIAEHGEVERALVRAQSADDDAG